MILGMHESNKFILSAGIETRKERALTRHRAGLQHVEKDEQFVLERFNYRAEQEKPIELLSRHFADVIVDVDRFD